MHSDAWSQRQTWASVQCAQACDEKGMRRVVRARLQLLLLRLWHTCIGYFFAFLADPGLRTVTPRGFMLSSPGTLPRKTLSAASWPESSGFSGQRVVGLAVHREQLVHSTHNILRSPNPFKKSLVSYTPGFSARGTASVAASARTTPLQKVSQHAQRSKSA